MEQTLSLVKPITLFQSEKENSLHESFSQSLLLDYKTIINDQVLLNHISDAVVLKNINSQFIGCNNKLALISGLDSPDQIVMKNDTMMIWGTGGLTPSFLSKDRLINRGITQLNIGRYMYNNGCETMLIRRFPLFYNQCVVGNMTILKNVSNMSLFKIMQSAYEMGVVINSNNIIETIDEQIVSHHTLNNFNLTIDEKKILYHLVRHATSKMIGLRLSTPYKTIEKRIKRLQNKFDCNNTCELVEKVFNLGIIKDLI